MIDVYRRTTKLNKNQTRIFKFFCSKGDADAYDLKRTKKTQARVKCCVILVTAQKFNSKLSLPEILLSCLSSGMNLREFSILFVLKLWGYDYNVAYIKSW